MELRRVTTGATLILAFILTLSVTHAFNITTILAEYSEFSTFNHYLSATHLASDINLRNTITVCVVDNAGMSELLSKHLSIYSIKNVLSLHVLLDYFGAKKLHQITNGTALAATMFQASGSASGTSGFVNITDLQGGRVGFAPEDNAGVFNVFFVKSVEERPYNISVIQISKILLSDVAAAPTPGPSQINLTSLMSAHGCKAFADTLLASDAIQTYEDNESGGISVFCPEDDAFKAFLPKYNNLTASGKTSLLLYHAIPVYMSLQTLKSNNGLTSTLATDGPNTYEFTVQNDGTDVTLMTKVVTSRITGTLFDEQPVVIYTINKVLEPKELFKADTPAPAPAPEKSADSPEAQKTKSPPISNSDSPADSPGDGSDHKAADDNGAAKFNGVGFAGLSLCLLLCSLI